MITWQRAIFLLCMAVVEATPVALLVTVAGGNAWLPLIGITLVGAIAARLSERNMPAQWHRPALLVLGLIAGVWLVKSTAGGGYGLLGGWGTIFNMGAGTSYLSLLSALYVFWRGTFLLDHDRVTVARVFARIVVALIIIIGAGALTDALTPALITLAANEIVTFFAAGLLAVALANMADQHSSSKLDWRGFATLVPAVAFVIGGGLLLTLIVGGYGAGVLGSIWRGVVLVFLIILSPLLFLFSLVVGLLSNLFDSEALRQMLERQQLQTNEATNQIGEQLNVPPWVTVLLQAFCILVPVLLMGLMYLLVRRRRRQGGPTNEERESLLSWGNLASDLGDLLANLRRRTRAAGLADALSRMRGGDPESRIRRSYIRLLLATESRDHPRLSAQTPHEFAPTASQALEKPATPIDTLTSAYERARYAPGTATASDAEQAEAAWQQIGEQTKRQP